MQMSIMIRVYNLFSFEVLINPSSDISSFSGFVDTICREFGISSTGVDFTQQHNVTQLFLKSYAVLINEYFLSFKKTV
jgi:hypothetical protein